jgi:hypothetical protein
LLAGVAKNHHFCFLNIGAAIHIFKGEGKELELFRKTVETTSSKTTARA